MTAQDFIAKWSKVDLTERSAAQQHFLDLCELVGHPKPAEADPTGDSFTFEKGASKHGGGDGWADVWKKDFFGWEYKGRHKDLGAAYDQLLEYRADLDNPPLLPCSPPSSTAPSKENYDDQSPEQADRRKRAWKCPGGDEAEPGATMDVPAGRHLPHVEFCVEPARGFWRKPR